MSVKKWLVAGITLVLLVGLRLNASAKEIIVPRDYDRIQDAVDAALVGDKVRVLVTK